jgi:hypothetical protein
MVGRHGGGGARLNLDSRQWSLAPLRPEPVRRDGRQVRTGVGSKGTAVTVAASAGVRWADKQTAHGTSDLFVVEVEGSEGGQVKWRHSGQGRCGLGSGPVGLGKEQQ